jgi:alpha-tubulin suppressor-like RCC1 family protein
VQFSPGGAPALVVEGWGYRFVSAGNRSILLIDAEGGLRRVSLRGLGDGQRKPLRIFAPRRFLLAHENWGTGIAVDRDGGLWYWDDEALERSRSGGAEVEPVQLEVGSRFVDACIQATRLHAVDDAGRLWRSRELRATSQRQGALPQGASTRLDPVAADAQLLQVRCRENASQVIALDAQGRLWGYGSGTFGELGLGDDGEGGTPYDAPALLPIDSGDTRFATIAVSKDITFAIATDGSLWGFGRNLDHELGLREGSSFDRPTPLTPGRSWLAVAGTFGGGVAIAADGSAHAWGGNTYGVLGDGGVARAHEVPLPVLTDVRFGGRD